MTASSGLSGTILFTAFEPSGDAHAAPVIAELKRVAPSLHICAFGGPRMQAAGATLIERTAEDGSMGLNAMSKYLAMRRHLRAIKRWSREYRVLAHIPVDSPAANFPISRAMVKRGARVINLIAPQMWAWGAWRVGKLRRLTSMVLCVLPFEEQWFNDRGVSARFIGHDAMNRELDMAAIQEFARGLPQSSPKIALFPGSRTHEVRANMRLLADAFNELQGRHSGMSGVIVAANPEIAKLIRRIISVFPTGLHLVTGKADAVIAWSDLALAVSGTVTLHIARQRKPMVGVYRTGWLSWLGAKVLLRTRFRLLPNIIADREICPEFVPHVGGPMPIVLAASKLVQDSKNAAIQSEGLRRVCLRFANKRPAEEAARLIVDVVKGGASA